MITRYEIFLALAWWRRDQRGVDDGEYIRLVATLVATRANADRIIGSGIERTVFGTVQLLLHLREGTSGVSNVDYRCSFTNSTPYQSDRRRRDIVGGRVALRVWSLHSS